MDSNHHLINGIRRGDIAAFEELHKKYYIFLCLVAEHIVKNTSDAEEIVSDVFVRLWNIRDKIDITTSVKGYLIKAVQNTALNYIERDRTSKSLTDSLSNSEQRLLAWDSDYPLGRLYTEEIMGMIEGGISALPDACREVFKLSRNEEMKYSTIAEKLGISVNTVKTQMKIALARLRETVKDYLLIFLFLLLTGI